ncbi:hypothetical protein [Rhodoglobus sp.]
MYTNPGPGNYATAKGRMFEAQAQAASAHIGGNILPRPERPYSYTRGILFSLLTIPIAAALVATFGLNSPAAAVATTPIAMIAAYRLFGYGSGRTPVTGRDFLAATGIGAITFIIAIIISHPYSLYLSYLYADGAGSILSPAFVTYLSTRLNENPGQIIIPIALVTVVAAVIVFRRARAARTQATPTPTPTP